MIYKRISKFARTKANHELLSNKRIDAFFMTTVIGEVKTENPNRKKRTPFSFFTVNSWQIPPDCLYVLFSFHDIVFLIGSYQTVGFIICLNDVTDFGKIIFDYDQVIPLS